MEVLMLLLRWIGILAPILIWSACLILWRRERSWPAALMALSQSLSLPLVLLLGFGGESLLDIGSKLFSDPGRIFFLLGLASTILGLIFALAFMFFVLRSGPRRDILL